jgi:2-keto-4-pentenoate hydratase/2-oxohepta-3-ene-1,7-dioic acid hydratase in catechol pathway
MKFVTFAVKTMVGPVQRVGVLSDGRIIDLRSSYAAYLREMRGVYRWRELAEAMIPGDMLTFIEGGYVCTDAARLAVDFFQSACCAPITDRDEGRLSYTMDEVKLMAPVTRPVSIRDCSAFLRHNKNMRGSEELPEVYYQLPAHYRASTTDVVGPDDPVLWPSYSEQLDYELEFAVCIGKYGVNIPAEKAEEYIFGYTIFNDISARDRQAKEMTLYFGPAKGKSFENSNIMGPCLVTPDEIDANNLKMVARINGEVWSEGNSGDMYHKFPQLISFLSTDDPIYPGEFIGSGTVGFGCGKELGKWLKPGDVVELEVEGIGVLRNKVTKKGAAR